MQVYVQIALPLCILYEEMKSWCVAIFDLYNCRINKILVTGFWITYVIMIKICDNIGVCSITLKSTVSNTGIFSVKVSLRLE